MIEGFRMWKEYGLIVPPEVQAATAEYKNDEDILADFIAENCERSGEIQSSVLYKAYKNWAEENGEKIKSNAWLGLQLDDRGYEKKRTGKGWIWQNLSVKNV
jgi:putative DNA primase/helicase